MSADRIVGYEIARCQMYEDGGSVLGRIEEEKTISGRDFAAVRDFRTWIRGCAGLALKEKRAQPF